MAENEKRFDAEEEAAEDRVPPGFERPEPVTEAYTKIVLRILLKAPGRGRCLRFPLQMFAENCGRQACFYLQGQQR